MISGSRIRSWKRLEGAAVLATILYVISQGLIVRELGPTGEDLVKLQFTFDFDAFAAIMAKWTPEDQARFLGHFRYDFIHPFIYGTSLCLGIAFALTVAGASPRWNRAILMPYVAAACDVLENIFYLKFFHLQRTEPGSAGLPGLFVLANTFCTLKWLIVAFGLTLLTSQWVRCGLRSLQNRRNSDAAGGTDRD